MTLWEAFLNGNDEALKKELTVENIRAEITAGAITASNIADRNKNGDTIVHCIVNRSNKEGCLKVLLEDSTLYPAIKDYINTKGSAGETPLYKACRYKKKAGYVPILLQYDADPAILSGEYNWSPLFVASRNGNLEAAQSLLAHEKKLESAAAIANKNDHVKPAKLVDFKTENSSSCLHIAAYSGWFKIVKLLLAAGAEVDTANATDATPLQAAIEGNLGIEGIQLLLDKGANPNACNKYKQTPLYYACISKKPGMLEVIECLLKADADPLAKSSDGHTLLAAAASVGNTEDGYTLLAAAASVGNTDIVKKLLASTHIDVNHQGRESKITALYFAAQNGYTEIVQALIDEGANVNLLSKMGRDPLNIAIRNGHEEIANLLRAKINETTSEADNKITLWQAFLRGDHANFEKEFTVDNIKTAITEHNIETQNDFGDTIVHYIVKLPGKENWLQTLLGANPFIKNHINMRDSTGETPLYKACCDKEKAGYVPILLDNGDADPTIVSGENGWSPLFIASKNGNLKAVKSLFERGRDLESVAIYDENDHEDHDTLVDFKTENGMSCLYIAAYSGELEIVKLLLDAGAKVNTADATGATPLQAAIEGNLGIEGVQLLLKEGANPNTCNEAGKSPLYYACVSKNVGVINCLLKADADPLVLHSSEYAPLAVVALVGNADSITKLLNASDTDIDFQGGDQQVTALYLAAAHGHTEVVKALIDAGANVNLLNKMGRDPLNIAMIYNHSAVVALLRAKIEQNKTTSEADNKMTLWQAFLRGDHANFEKKFTVDNIKTAITEHNIETQNDFGDTLVHYIVKLPGKENWLQTLLRASPFIKNHINMRDSTGETPLYKACCDKEKAGYVPILLDDGEADPIIVSGKNDWSPLYVASRNGNLEAVKSLLNRKRDLESIATVGNHHDKLVDFKTTNGGMSCLNIAANRGELEIVQLLLDAGANLNTCDDKGRSPLYQACMSEYPKSVEVVKYLLEAGADPLVSSAGYTPFMAVASAGNTDIVKELLDSNNVNINHQGGEQEVTALFLAVHSGHVDVVNVLIEKGADVNLLDNRGRSPLYIACASKNPKRVEVLKCLLEAGADPLGVASTGYTPFLVAICLGDPDIVKELLDSNKVDINHRGGANKVTALHLAAEQGNTKVVQVLIAAGANVNLLDDMSVSPLYIAAQNGHTEVVKALIDAGADVNLRSKTNLSPLEVANTVGHTEVANLISRRKILQDVASDMVSGVISEAASKALHRLGLSAEANREINDVAIHVAGAGVVSVPLIKANLI